MASEKERVTKRLIHLNYCWKAFKGAAIWLVFSIIAIQVFGPPPTSRDFEDIFDIFRISMLPFMTPTTPESSPTTPSSENCIFCEIAANKSSTRVIYEDETFVAFKDIRPAAAHHMLIIPRAHISSVQKLTPESVQMLQKMKEIGTNLLTGLGVPDASQQLGFHVPPFNSINHLHLHVIAKPFRNFLSAAKYPNGWKSCRWWIELDRLTESLKKGENFYGNGAYWNWSWT